MLILSVITAARKITKQQTSVWASRNGSHLELLFRPDDHS